MESFTNDLESYRNVAIILLQLIGLVLLVPLLIRILRVRRRPQLVFPDFSGADKEAQVQNAAQALSQIAREKLVEQLKVVREKVRSSIVVEGLGEAKNALSKSPLPQDVRQDPLDTLITSVGSELPQGGSSLARLLSEVIARPTGDRIRGILHFLPGAKPRSGVTIEIADLRGEQEPSFLTLWKEADFHEHGEGRSDESPGAWQAAEGMAAYEQMLAPAMRWLALHLARRDIERRLRKPFLMVFRSGQVLVGRIGLAAFRLGRGGRDGRIGIREGRSVRQGILRNYFGLLLQGSASTFPEYRSTFLDLAIEEFREAASVMNSYQPHENMADTLVMKASEQEGEERPALDEALLAFGRALTHVSDGTPEGILISRRVSVGQALARLMTKDSGQVQEARRDIAQVESSEWSEDEETDTRTLYNLACWYELAGSLGIIDQDAARLKSRRYLVCSLVRSDLFWRLVDTDPDLRALQRDVSKVKAEISRRQIVSAQLQTLTGPAFGRVVDEILTAVGWLEHERQALEH